MAEFKTPLEIPQDLLFIQDLVNEELPPPPVVKAEPVESDVDSSDTENEVEALLVETEPPEPVLIEDMTKRKEPRSVSLHTIPGFGLK